MSGTKKYNAIANRNDMRKSDKKVILRDKTNNEDRKMVIGQCNCGKNYFIWLSDWKSIYNYLCPKCEGNNIIKRDELVESSYTCKCCGKKYSFLPLDQKEYSLNCKHCGEPTTMEYDIKRKMMTSK